MSGNATNQASEIELVNRSAFFGIVRSLEDQLLGLSPQRIAFTTPPSTRSAAPLVADESSLAR
jgi:hypothetical protein